MSDRLTIACIQETFREGQIINGVKQVGLAASVQPEQTIHFSREPDGCLVIVLKIDQSEFL